MFASLSLFLFLGVLALFILALLLVLLRFRRDEVTPSAEQLQRAWARLDVYETRIAALEAIIIEHCVSHVDIPETHVARDEQPASAAYH